MSLFRHRIRTFRRLVYLTVPGLMAGTLSSLVAAEDYASLGEQLLDQQALVTALQSQHDRVDHSLLEPLLGLARTQTRANRFDDAQDSLGHAIQVVRIRDGLYAPTQYSILEQSIDNNIRRGAWETVTEQLDHLQWLYADRFEGDVEEQIERLMWASQTYLQATHSDLEIRQVEHLKNATRLNTLAHQLAASQQQLALETRIRVAYELIKKYHLEAQGIRRGGEFGFHIRSAGPNLGKVESRKTALRRRYIYGLRVLEQIRDYVQSAGPDNVEALMLVDLGVADWQLLFNKREALDKYPQVYRQLARAGVDSERLDTLFAAPVALPEAELLLDLDAALASRSQDPRAPLTLVQRSVNFPGVTGDSVPDSRLPGAPAGRYLTAEVHLSLDPFTSNSHWLNGTLRTTWGTGSNIQLTSTLEDLQRAREVTEHLREVHLRPTLAAGELQQTDVEVRYLVRRNAAVREYSVLDALQLSQVDSTMPAGAGGGGD